MTEFERFQMSDINIPDITDDQFEQEVLKCDMPVLVDYWAPHCMPCHGFAIMLQDVAKKYAGRMKIVKVNVAKHRRYANIVSRMMPTPTSVIYYKGVIVDHNTGAGILEYFCKFVDKTLRDIEDMKDTEGQFQVPVGYKLLRDTTRDQRDYPADFHSEHGHNECVCGHCGRNFGGHKRRTICRACTEEQNTPL